MGTGYLLDSNIVIGFLAGKIPPPGMTAVSGIIDDTSHISVITQIEVLRFNDTPDNEKILIGFINNSVIHPLDAVVVRRTIELCRQYKIKLPDAVIAATALNEGFTLVTRNISDFKGIAGLEILNPFTLS